MRCARYFISVISFAVIFLDQPQVLAQDVSNNVDSSSQSFAQNNKTRIDVKDVDSEPADEKKPAKAKKAETGNVTLSDVPKMSEVAKQPIYWMCKNRADVRTIRVEAEKGTCTTRYSKEGTEKEASKSGAMRACYQVFANIRRNLENAEYKCRDISTSRISSSN